MKRRANGKGNAVFLGANREKQWGARITLGQDEDGKQIRHNLGLFNTELDALTRSGKNSPTSTSGEMNCQKKLLTNYCINGTIIQAIKGVWQVYE